MLMLNFYLNRPGLKRSPERKRVLVLTNVELRKLLWEVKASPRRVITRKNPVKSIPIPSARGEIPIHSIPIALSLTRSFSSSSLPVVNHPQPDSMVLMCVASRFRQ